MRIDLRCRCGATFVAESGEFINKGGKPDAKGRVFVVELRSDEWQDRHAACPPIQYGGLTIETLKPGPFTCGSGT